MLYIVKNEKPEMLEINRKHSQSKKHPVYDLLLLENCYGKLSVAKFNKIEIQYLLAKIQHSGIESHILLNLPFQKIQHSMMKV